jgi:hypothetical protein
MNPTLGALVAGVLFALASTAAAETCEQAYAGVATLADSRALTCTRVTEEAVATSHGAVQISVWVRSPAPAGDAMVAQAMLNTMRRAIPIYAGFRAMPPTIVGVVGRDRLDWMHGEQLGVDAAEQFDSRGHRCVVDVAVASLRAGTRGGTAVAAGEQLNWIIAHELFHCLQAANFPQMDVDGHDWWIEGEAEYFPSFVWNDRISDRFGQFDEESARHNLFEIDHAGRGDTGGYANVAFMLGFAGRSSTNYLLDVFAGLPATSDHTAQAAHLAGDPFFVALFHSFSKDFFTGSIPSHLPPTNPQLATSLHFPHPTTIANNVDLGFAPTSAGFVPIADEADARREVMHFYRGRLMLPAHHRYRIDALGGGEIALLAEGYDWMENPTETVIDACDDPIPALAVADAVDPHQTFAPHLRIQVQPAAPEVCGRRDPCLVGRWRVDQSYMDRIATSLGAGANAHMERGPMEIAFAASGVWLLEFNHLTTRWQSPLGASRLVFEGKGQGRWAAPTPGTLRSSISSDTSYERLYVVNGRHQTGPMRLPGVVSGYGVSAAPEAYQCTPDTLTFARPTGAIVYHRVSRDPGFHARSDFNWAH